MLGEEGAIHAIFQLNVPWQFIDVKQALALKITEHHTDSLLQGYHCAPDVVLVGFTLNYLILRHIPRQLFQTHQLDGWCVKKLGGPQHCPFSCINPNTVETVTE
jgi:hypothetical protein